jgi:hypothetical protein
MYLNALFGELMVRRHRRWVAGLMTIGLVFAQFVTVAHACTFAIPALQAAAIAQPADETMPSDCAAMAKRVAANAKVCEVHCTYGQQIDVQSDAPVAAIAPQTALTVRVMSSIVRPSRDTSFLHARSTAPPVSLLFSRFLI